MKQLFRYFQNVFKSCYVDAELQFEAALFYIEDEYLDFSDGFLVEYLSLDILSSDSKKSFPKVGLEQNYVCPQR